MQRINENLNGRDVWLIVEEELEVTLVENASAGYLWFLTPPDPAIVKVVDEAAHRGGASPGAPGARIWRLKAAGPGDTRLRFDTRRSWETTGSRSFQITLHVAAE